jgi:histidinol-phosphate aminotransferase
MELYHGVDPMEVMAERAGIPPEKIIRLNGNENPYGPSPQVAKALGSFRDYNHYPDPAQRNLRAALSDYLGVPDANIVAGNGSDEIIDLLMRMFLAPDDEIIIPVPTFGMYSFSADVAGARAVSVPRDDHFDIDIEAIKGAINPRTKAIFFPSPNNPTGNLVTEAQSRALLDTGLLVVADEAYYDFCGQSLMNLLPEYRNLVVLRTFSKWAGLAGLRIGAGAMDAELAATMMGMKPPYNVNLAAEIALLASLEDTSNLLERVDAIVTERSRLYDLLSDVPGITPWPSQANFVLCKMPDGRGLEVYEGMCRRGVFLRYFDNDLLRDYIRVSVGKPEETDAVIAGFRAVLGAEE